jgi:hypothetical protein
MVMPPAVPVAPSAITIQFWNLAYDDLITYQVMGALVQASHAEPAGSLMPEYFLLFQQHPHARQTPIR